MTVNYELGSLRKEAAVAYLRYCPSIQVFERRNWKKPRKSQADHSASGPKIEHGTLQRMKQEF
jgi:hypothetical protein